MENKSQKLKKLILMLVVTLFLVTLAYSAYIYVNRSTIIVSGTYSQKESNETAAFNIYLNSRSATKDEAVNLLKIESTKIIEELKSAGIPSEDLRTTNFSVYQEEIWNQNTNESEKGDWIASSNMAIKLEDGKRASEISTLLAMTTVNSFDGPHFSLSDKEIDDAMYLQKAFENAYEKANDLARAQGKRIAKVIEIEESMQSGVFMNARMDLMSGAGGGGNMPLEPGSSEISRSVLVKFELR